MHVRHFTETNTAISNKCRPKPQTHINSHYSELITGF